MKTEAKRLEEAMKEMEIFGKELAKKVDGEFSEALQMRSAMMGSLTAIAELTTEVSNRKHQELVDKNPDLPEWKIRVMLEGTTEYRIEAFRRRLVNTVELQSKALTSQLIERQSERKLAR